MTAPHSVESYWRQGATRLGISFGEYARHILAGERWCSNRGHGWRPVTEFGIAAKKRSGLTTFCRDCDRETALARYHQARSETS